MTDSLAILHQQNVVWSLGAFGFLWELSDQKLRVVKFQCLLDWCIGHQVHPEAPGSSSNKSESADHKPGSTWESWQQARVRRLQALEHIRVLATTQRSLTTSLGMLSTTLRACWITVEQSGKTIFGNAASVPGNHSYYLSFNNFQNLWIQFVFTSRYLYSYLSTHGISGLAAGDTWEQLKVHRKMTINSTQRFIPLPYWSELEEAFGGWNWATPVMRWEAIHRWAWRGTLRLWLN